MFKRLFMFFMLLGMPFGFVYAEEVCSAKYMADLKVKVTMITANQKYVGNYQLNGNYQWYELTFDFQGLDNEVFISTSSSGDRVYDSNGKLYIESGKRTLNIYSAYCAEYKVGTLEVDLPKFNEKSLDASCTFIYGNDYLEECDPWNQNSVSDADLDKAVEKYYEERNKQELPFYKKYFWFMVGGGVILFILIIILFVRRYKRNRLD